jgi:uncharacterized Zn finger protein (UPF0148 family)
MLSQNVDCQKCGFSNKLGTIYCRNCGTKLKFDKKALDTEKNRHVKKIISRSIKAIIVLVVLIIAGMAFLPWGFSEPQKITDSEELKAIVTTCDEIDDVLSRDQGKAEYEFTVPELNYAIAYLTIEHEKKVKKPSSSTPMAFGSGASNLGGVTKLGGGDLGSKPSMELKSKAADAAPPEPTYVDNENARRQAWKKRKIEDAKNAGKRTDRSPHFDFIVSIKDDKTLSVVAKERWIKYLPCRIELYVQPEVVINQEDNSRKLRFKITKAYFGHLPLPLFMEEHIVALFEEVVMQEREWAKQYLEKLQNVEINNDLIKITVGQ